MNHLIRAFRSPVRSTLLLVIMAVIASITLGRLIAIGNFGIREGVILTLGLLLGILILMPTERILRFGLVLWILTFALGWRTVHVTSILSFHPTEAFAWVLFFSIVGSKIVRHTPIDFSLPAPFPFLMLFTILGMLTAVSRGTRNDIILQESKVFLALIPSYYIVKWLVASRADWEWAARWTMPVALYVSCLGLLDYFAPSWSVALMGNASIPTAYVSADGFTRVGFIFYGNFSAGFLILTFLGLSVHYFLTSWEANWWKSVFSGLAVLIESVGIYLSGYRSAWYAFGAFVLTYAVLRRRARILLVGMAASIPFLTSGFFLRLKSVVDWEHTDSSAFQRLGRARQGLNLIRESPLTGLGWGGSGYVHSDLIQIGANLGLLAMAVFLLWILGLMWQLLRLARQTRRFSEYASALFATLCGLLIIWAVGGIMIWIQLMVPIWYVISMSHKIVELASQEVTTVS